MRPLVLLLASASMAVAGFAAAPAAALSTFPGTNGQIVFAALPTPGAPGMQIYTIEPNGTGLRQLTHLDGNATSPHWSPDGTRIVFELSLIHI